jgi:hypothetical protein
VSEGEPDLGPQAEPMIDRTAGGQAPPVETKQDAALGGYRRRRPFSFFS